MNLRESRAAGWGALVLMVVVIILAVSTRIVSEIWEYIPLFFAFMAVFCHIMALTLLKMSASAAKKLDVSALVFGILAILSLIVVFILNWCS